MKNIYVGNLSSRTTENTLRSAFAVYGEVRDLHLVRDYLSGMPRGFAFIDMARDQDAEKAVAALNDSRLDGRRIIVSPARRQSGGLAARRGEGKRAG